MHLYPVGVLSVAAIVLTLGAENQEKCAYFITTQYASICLTSTCNSQKLRAFATLSLSSTISIIILAKLKLYNDSFLWQKA